MNPLNIHLIKKHTYKYIKYSQNSYTKKCDNIPLKCFFLFNKYLLVYKIVLEVYPCLC